MCPRNIPEIPEASTTPLSDSLYTSSSPKPIFSKRHDFIEEERRPQDHPVHTHMNDTETPNSSSTACPQRVRERSQLRGPLVLNLYSQVHEARILTLVVKEEGSEVHRSPNQGRADNVEAVSLKPRGHTCPPGFRASYVCPATSPHHITHRLLTWPPCDVVMRTHCGLGTLGSNPRSSALSLCDLGRVN